MRYRVVLVMDPQCGDRLRLLAKDAHVWAIRSPENERAAEAFWERLPVGTTYSEQLESGITVFNVQPLGLGLLDSVIEHHGEFSHDPPVDAIDVLGHAFSEQVRATFVMQGFPHFVQRPDGFLATREQE